MTGESSEQSKAEPIAIVGADSSQGNENDDSCKVETACDDAKCCKDSECGVEESDNEAAHSRDHDHDYDHHHDHADVHDHDHASENATSIAGDGASVGTQSTTCCGSVERCDENCIYAAAALECAKVCDDAETGPEAHNHEHNEDGKHPEAACKNHLLTAFEQYSSYLEQARCICRSVISRGYVSPAASCCATTGNREPKANTKTRTKGKQAAKDARDGHATGYVRPHHHHRGSRHYHHEADGAPTASLRRRNVNANVKPAAAQRSCGNVMDHDHDHNHDHDHDHDHSKIEGIHRDHGHAHAHAHAHGESCCGGPDTPAASRADPHKGFDLEKAPDHELVSVAISGMDCTSCGDKLTRVLLLIEGVSQARVNFIAGRADFTINTLVTNTNDAIRLASTGSGFHLTRIIGGDYFLDIVTSPKDAKSLIREPPMGVTDIEALDKTTLRLAYDPAIIGARVLFNGLSGKTQGLAPPRSDPQLENSRRRLWDQLAKTCVAAVLTIPVATLSWGEGLVDDKTKTIISLILGTLVQGIAVPEFYRPALMTFWYSRIVEMDMLVVISITVAYCYSIVASGLQLADRPLRTSELFETSTLLITLILFGRLIATLARVRAVAAVSLRSLQTNTAVLVEEGTNVDREIDARLLQYGDRFKLLPHSRVPTDGTVISGTSEIDESMLTGESLPVLKQTGSAVVAGTVNGDGTVLVQLDRLPGKNTVTDIAQMVDNAANSKPRIQDLADKVAGWFVPAVSSIALAVLVIWLSVSFEVLAYPTDKAVEESITYFVATLAVACPCALGLAVPMVLIVAGGIAARGGIIIKSAETTERARKVTDVIFDKTGTITESDLVVVQEAFLSDQDKDVAMIKELVSGGRHPVSAAVAKHLEGANSNLESEKRGPDVSDVRIVPGSGIEAHLGDKRLRAGHPRWTSTESHPVVQDLQGSGLTTMVVTVDSNPVAIFGLRTQIRPEAAAVVAGLKARNVAVHLVSGDQKLAVMAVAGAVGIPEHNVAAQRTPIQKQQYVASLMEDGSRYVMFCGDGTNDAVAVAQANIGVQIGGALATSDVTQSAADVILLNGLEGIPLVIKVSQAAFSRMTFNFVWSAVYNVLAITMASGAWVKFRIHPAYAGLGEFVSVLPVIVASMTMFRLNLKQPTTVRA